MRTIGLAICLLVLAACGENIPPSIQEVRVSNPTSGRFQELFITLVGVEDPDGNVYAGKVRVKARSADGDVELDEELRPFETEPNRIKGDVIFGVRISGDVPLGLWTIEVTFEDEAGAEADPVYAEVTLTS